MFLAFSFPSLSQFPTFSFIYGVLSESDCYFYGLWKDNFHLRVNNGIFSETLGSAENPLPSLEELDSIWVVVVDLFSSFY